MTRAEWIDVAALIMSGVALTLSVVVGWTVRSRESKYLGYQLEEIERSRAARDNADLRPTLNRTSGGASLSIHNHGGGTAVDLKISLRYPNAPEFDPAPSRITQERLRTELLPPEQAWEVPLPFPREILRPPLEVTLEWTDKATGTARKEIIPCAWR
jgi:hypothetical protein